MTEPNKIRSETVVKRLRDAAPALKEAGCVHLALFGSLARGDARPESDIDLAAVYDDHIVTSAWEMAGIAGMIAGVLGNDDFDLANEERLRPPVRRNFEREHVRIF